jgi:RNA ligase (TIGR02306 family)
LENVKWFPDLFKDGELVIIQEKLHGSNCRAGKLRVVKPKAAHILNEVKNFNLKGALVLLCKFIKMTLNNEAVYENVYGSNNVELTNRNGNKGYYGENVYLNVLNKVNAFDKIKPNEIVYGELIGEGIQKNYHYGHKEHHFVIFDVKVFQEDGTAVWLEPWEVELYAEERGFDIVPKLYYGTYNKEIAYGLTKGDSVYNPTQKIREGIVIKAVKYNDKSCPSNKKALKWISEEYLDKDNSDNH